jgi:hypothetical protein
VRNLAPDAIGVYRRYIKPSPPPKSCKRLENQRRRNGQFAWRGPNVRQRRDRPPFPAAEVQFKIWNSTAETVLLA